MPSPHRCDNYTIIRLLAGLGMYPDTDPVCYLTPLVITGLMRHLRLEMLDLLQAIPARLSKLIFEETSVFAVRQLLNQSRQVSHVDLKRQSRRRTTNRRIFIRCELKTHQPSLQRQKLAIPLRPVRSY